MKWRRNLIIIDYLDGSDHPVSLLLAEDGWPLVQGDLLVGVYSHYQVVAHGFSLPAIPHQFRIQQYKKRKGAIITGTGTVINYGSGTRNWNRNKMESQKMR
jgi:hypothetical protein